MTDKDGGVGQSVYQFVVMYDPAGGFVTGGGWITSPAGAYAANPALTGKATFGFESKYKTAITGVIVYNHQVLVHQVYEDSSASPALSRTWR